MSRWDTYDFDSDGSKNNAEHEEARLLEKFNEYRRLEITELEKCKHSKAFFKEKIPKWDRRFLAMTVIQTIIIAALAISILFMEFVDFDFKILIAFLALGGLWAETVLLTKYFRNKANKNAKEQLDSNTKTEFDGI